MFVPVLHGSSDELVIADLEQNPGFGPAAGNMIPNLGDAWLDPFLYPSKAAGAVGTPRRNGLQRLPPTPRQGARCEDRPQELQPCRVEAHGRQCHVFATRRGSDPLPPVLCAQKAPGSGAQEQQQQPCNHANGWVPGAVA